MKIPPATLPATTSRTPIATMIAIHNAEGAEASNIVEFAAPKPASIPTSTISSRGTANPFNHGVAISKRCTREATTPMRCGLVAIRPATRSKITKNHSINFAESALDSVPTETTFASARLSACDADIAPALFMIKAVSSTTVTPSANSIVEPSGAEPMNCTLWPPSSIFAGTERTSAKAPSAPTSADPSFVGVE